VITTSSPGCRRRPSASARKYVSVVMLAPKLTSAGSQPRKSAPALCAWAIVASVSSLVTKRPWQLALWSTR
jgi:hypothetical protein